MARRSSRVIPANEYRRVRWKNGLGWTREIDRDRDGDDWSWRLSIAEVEQDGDFSLFPGIERELVMLKGHGMRLCFDDGEVIGLEQPHARHRFGGLRPLHAELIDGPTQDFNVMWRPEHWDTQVMVRPLVDQMVFFAGAGVGWAIHLLAGEARFGADAGLEGLWMGDTAILEADEPRTRYLLQGGGELLLVRLEAKPEAQ